ncbi:hypothetical protein GC174_05180 [bacterium]|nr:hypothetical protein [bacterium]
MFKSLTSLMVATGIIAASAAPCLAADAQEMAKGYAMFPVKALAIGTGTVVGIPIAITRRASSRSVEFTQNFADQIGGHENIVPSAFAMLMGVPFGLLVGTGEGVYYGGKNGIVNGYESPFSLSSFSLDTDLEGE